MSAVCVTVGFGVWVEGSVGTAVVLTGWWPVSSVAPCLRRGGLGKTPSAGVVFLLVPGLWFSSEAVASPSAVGLASCGVPPIAAGSFLPCATLLAPADEISRSQYLAKTKKCIFWE